MGAVLFLCIYVCREDNTSESIAMILKAHFDKVIIQDPDDVGSITIRRKHIWRDAIRAISRTAFNPNKSVHVTFIGEEAVDGGGPRREFFTLALQEMAEDGNVFQGPPHSRYFLHNVQALASKKYFYAGMLVAISLANGGPGLPCLAEALYTYLCFGLHGDFAPDLSLLPDSNLQECLQQVRFSISYSKTSSLLQHSVRVVYAISCICINVSHTDPSQP